MSPLQAAVGFETAFRKETGRAGGDPCAVQSTPELVPLGPRFCDPIAQLVTMFEKPAVLKGMDKDLGYRPFSAGIHLPSLLRSTHSLHSSNLIGKLLKRMMLKLPCGQREQLRQKCHFCRSISRRYSTGSDLCVARGKPSLTT